ncbi:uncharacterized protein LOC111265562 isoform X2 [Varroa jacobsoni]|uniref:Uncharacterized protein n=1 Tax=Varroa destructor TaxID=109461 RepID=A0A7M7JZB4_VARDE|nr:uncharacterized protein LOC111246996 isoform X2 [Varroa destructor]XP_022698198.1 uncharacterized protein LOC111265562 isoform X2 [Varroa jacobsoni]
MNHRDPTKPPYFSAGERTYLRGTAAYRNQRVIAAGTTFCLTALGAVFYVLFKDRKRELNVPLPVIKGPFVRFLDEDGKPLKTDPNEVIKNAWKSYLENISDTERLKFWKREFWVPK